MRKALAAGLVLLAVGGAVLARRPQADLNLTERVQSALVARTASAPDIARAEAVLANRCMAARFLRPLLAVPIPRIPSPFAEASTTAADDTLRGATNQELEALFGSADVRRVAATAPDGRQLSTSTVGCLAETRTHLYGSLRSFVAQVAMGDWLANEWRSELKRALLTPRGADARAKWARCARSKGHSAELSDVYVPAYLPFDGEPSARSRWKDERYCRVASGLMAALREGVVFEPRPGAGVSEIRAFVAQTGATLERARRALREG